VDGADAAAGGRRRAAGFGVNGAVAGGSGRVVQNPGILDRVWDVGDSIFANEPTPPPKASAIAESLAVAVTEFPVISDRVTSNVPPSALKTPAPSETAS